ncbi:MAG TPA: hypothetical protein VFB96_15700 [Pirellulaceae bacterium]|nr:hypothetical protein [Pirellulaceae bacterium]
MRTIIAAAIACSLGLGASGSAFAQNNAPTTVQLPTFSFFTVQTAVSVPDSGGAYLGGVSRAYNSSTTRGLPFWAKTPWLSPLGGSRGIASGVDAGGVSVHATIIDHEELDKAVLSEAAARRVPPSETDLKAEHLSRKSGDGNDAAPLSSVAAIRAQQTAEVAEQAEKAAALFAKAQEMEAANKPGQARIYYRMAARHADDDLKQQISARLAALK